MGSIFDKVESAREHNRPCPFAAPRCMCWNCANNAAYEDCEKGYCIHCFECQDAGHAVHDVYLCTGYEKRTEE